MMEARIVKTCSCTNFGVVETGLGTSIDAGRDYVDHLIIQVYGRDGLIRYSNREPHEEMDNLEMICIRCGATARFE